MKLDIGIFTEYYPNTFKSYLDWQIIELMKQGHTVTIYAHNAWDEIIDPEVTHYNLHKKVRRYPSTMKHLLRTVFSLHSMKLSRYASALKILSKHHMSLKKKIVSAFRAAIVKPHHDVCLMNDLATAAYFTFIKDLFPSTYVAVYYHGAPLPGVYNGYMKNKEMIFAMADIIFANSQYSLGTLIELGCPKEKIVVIPVGINLAKFTPPTNKVYKKEGITHIVSVGRISPEKGFLYAINAVDIIVKKGYNIVYYIIGQGPQERELLKKIKTLNLTEKIHLVGKKTNSEIVKILSESDILILPSVPCEGCVETQGVVVQEAQAMKLPVIASNVGGIPEGLLDNCSGLLVEPFNSSAIAEKLMTLISLPSNKLAEYGENGRMFVASKYCIEHTMDQMCTHLTNWLKKRMNENDTPHSH